MSELLSGNSPTSSLGLGDIIFAVFKHKWKIVAGALAGIIAALALYYLYTPLYESHAKLLVRYVLERAPLDQVDAGSVKTSDNVMGSEVEILTSWDLAMQVVDSLGVKRLLPGSAGNASKASAAATISSGLTVTPGRNSNVIFVSYANSDPELAVLVLDELLNRYFTKHLEVHRSAGAFDFVTQQTDQVRARLSETEDALRVLKGKAGIISYADSTAALSTALQKAADEVDNAEMELTAQRARVKRMEESGGGDPVAKDGNPASGTSSAKAAKGKSTAKNTAARRGSSSKAANKSSTTEEGPASAAASTEGPAALPETKGETTKPSPAKLSSSNDLQHYQAIVGRLQQLRQSQLDLLSKYTSENIMVKLNREQIIDLEKQKADLEEKFPDLATSGQPGTSPPASLNAEKARLEDMEARTETLRAHKANIQNEVKKLAEVGSQIADLERNQELEIANYKYFKGTLEKARVDEALDPTKMPNISTVQRPSPPSRVFGKRDKFVKFLAAGGLAVALAITLLSELVVNQTVKRPLELEKRLGTRLLMSIPLERSETVGRLPWKRRRRGKALIKPNGQDPSVAPWDPGHFIRAYADAIRDRLGLYFELNRMTHKPKLVGVTGFSDGAGVSTLAAGLAAALSETGDGKVLLVDANLGPGEVHPFFNGRPTLPLLTALQSNGSLPSAADNLYLATVGSSSAGPAQLGLKKFFDLMPNLKASEFDYVIFDMPPLAQTSPTLGMAGFMDKMLLVVESEKNNRDVVRRGYEALCASRDNVSVVFNKARSYLPQWLHSAS
jgi:uncharacterized protein involved in exopolysaccharide biosynthesis/Mrp family chromosome partitioning ATPase